MSSLVLGDLILESLTPSVNAPLETLPFSWWSFEKIVDNNFKLSYSTFYERLPQEVVNNNFSRKRNASSSPFYINHPGNKGKNYHNSCCLNAIQSNLIFTIWYKKT
jgi:hypothetical protein